MPTLPTEALSALGAVCAAFIAAVISLLGLVISKEHKVSEFRQEWNDALREDVALLITHVECLRGAAHAAAPHPATWADRREHFIVVNRAITAIRLRVRAGRLENNLFLKALAEMEDAAQAGDIGTTDRLGPAVESLTDTCSKVIENEWTLIRKGEGVYLWSRYGSISMILVALLLLAIFTPVWLRSAHLKNQQNGAATNKTATQALPETRVYVFLCDPYLKQKTGTTKPSCVPQFDSTK